MRAPRLADVAKVTAPAATPVRQVGDDERRARLARRHALHPDHRLSATEDVVAAMTALHATEAASVHLAVAARSTGLTVVDVERALYDDRSVVKQLAMRRTLFTFPRELLPAVLGSSSARVAVTERSRHAVMLERAGLTDDGVTWLLDAEAAALAVLADGVARTSTEVRALTPEHDVMVDPSPGRAWSRPGPVAPWVLTQLAAAGEIVRGANAGHWRVNKPTWTTMAHWLGDRPEPLPAREGYAELVRCWLRTFGPGTETDLQWWLGDTKTATRQALADVAAVPVGLDSGDVGWLLPDDVDPVGPVAPWATLLPVLDPTVMGWKQRGFYLPEERLHSDTNGNLGTTVWWDGRVVGCWVQEPDGRVVPVLDAPLPGPAETVVRAEAERLSAWLDGQVVGTVYPSPAMKAARARV